MIGGNEPFDVVPFFWSAYTIRKCYMWVMPRPGMDGSVEARDRRVAFWSGSRTLAVATIGRVSIARVPSSNSRLQGSLNDATVEL
jgi:hypothetical protein